MMRNNNYAQIRDMDIVNGEGIVCSLFVQGCSHHCKGCFNSETWNENEGKPFTKKIEDEFIELCKNPIIDGVSILGGEPFEYCNLFNLVKRIKREVNKPLWVWTGYTFEQIKLSNSIKYIDVLIDGKFEIDKRDLKLAFRGSSNQRVIDVQKSLKENKIILYHK